MMMFSLLINVAVLIPVCLGLVTHAQWTLAAYGPPTPARAILLAVYVSILAVSCLLLWLRDPKLVAALLMVQIIYKVITPFTVGGLRNPVVVSNLVIAAVHMGTLAVLWRRVTA